MWTDTGAVSYTSEKQTLGQRFNASHVSIDHPDAKLHDRLLSRNLTSLQNGVRWWKDN